MIPKILIVDDDKDIISLFEQAFKYELEEQLFSFVFRFSSEEAIEFIEIIDNTTLVLILSDINMPGRNGFDLLKEIKDKHQEIPVYLFTAYDDENKRQLAEQLKANQYLVKPIDFDALRENIMSLIKS
jgi:CheY-like chemotaxis protein